MEVKLNLDIANADDQERIHKKIKEVAAIAEDLPGVIIIHETRNFTVKFMSKRGLVLIGATLEELQKVGPEYHAKFFNPEDNKDYLPKIISLMSNNTDETISFFQQVRYLNSPDWKWHISAIRILLRDHAGKPLLTITTAVNIDPSHHITAKVSRLLEENNFLRKHYHQFSSLGKREAEILKLMALGKTSAEISEELFISTATVDTHRRNIKRKLEVNSSYELSLYARAFDLI
ncbi:MAG TPA: helix-turn-helix transcriptional regulator [Emticicia sp.]